MNIQALRSIAALGIAVLLTACGGGNSQLDMPTRTAAAMQTSVSAQVATNTMPAPDCAAEGCKGLRIIDANAEAYRYEAMRRAAAADAAAPTQS